MDIEIRQKTYSVLSGDGGKIFTFFVDGEEKYSESFSNSDIYDLNITSADEMLAGDWEMAIEARYLFLPYKTKEFIRFLNENEEKFNDSIAKKNISRLEREMKSWKTYLIEEVET